MEILCLGIFTVDIFAKLASRTFEPGKWNWLNQAEIHTGGTACNTAIDLTRLGISVGVMGKVGVDLVGELILQKLRREGVDIQGVKKDADAHTSLCVFLATPDGESTYLYYPGTNARLSPQDIDMDLIKKAKILHIGGTYLMPQFDGCSIAQLLKKAKQYGIVTSLDPVPNLTENCLKLIQPLFKYLDIFLPNLEQARTISGKGRLQEIADFFLSRGVGTVVIKMGEQGCFIKKKNEIIKLPAYQVKVVDVTGAGDAFVAGFLTGIIQGWDLNRTGKFANAVGALCVGSMGCTDGIKSRSKTLQFIKSQEITGALGR